MSEKPVKVFRIALRAEGEWLLAYFAATDTMADAVELGRISRAACELDGELWIAWQAIWSAWSERAVRLVIPVEKGDIGIEVEDAPEHERNGRG